MPAEGAASVSVVSKRGVWADALDTGLLVMGVEAGAAAADRLAEVGVLLISDQGQLRRAGPLGARFEAADRAVTPRADSRE
jgi:thiamine biosynthesis lipoprotein ApbE